LPPPLLLVLEVLVLVLVLVVLVLVVLLPETCPQPCHGRFLSRL
jgi:hypothetical protein